MCSNLIIDASGTWSAQAELASVTRVAQAGVKVTNWMSVSAEILRDWSLPVANSVGALYGKYQTSYGYLMNNLSSAQRAKTQTKNA